MTDRLGDGDDGAVSQSDQCTYGTNRYWQQCEMPECRNDVPVAKGICDECVGGSCV